jgi:hypothetical protein
MLGKRISTYGDPRVKILFFSPFAAVWKHAESEIDIALELKKSGHDVSFMRCGTEFKNFCLAMSAFGLTYASEESEKLEVCTRCTRSRQFVNEDLELTSLILGQFGEINQDDRNFAATVNEENWDSFTYLGLPVGQYAAYEFSIHHKLISRTIPKRLLPEYISALEYTIYVARISEQILKSGDFEKVIVYNRFYSVNRVLCKIAENLGIPTFSLQASGPANSFYSRFTLVRDDLAAMNLADSAEWQEAAKRTLARAEIKFVGKHLEGLLNSKNHWVFSDAATKIRNSDLRNFLKVPQNCKIVLMATSSQDELSALEITGVIPKESRLLNSSIFENQQEWLEKAILELRDREDVFLVVRIHPREFENQDEASASANASELLMLLNRFAHPRMYVNTPADKLSIYNLMTITDLLLTGYSSVGAEFAAFGVPVLSHYKFGVGYPRELVSFEENVESYFHRLHNLIYEPIPSNKLLAFRWFNFRFNVLVRGYESKGFSRYKNVLSLWRRPKLKYGVKFPKFFTKSLVKLYLNSKTVPSPFVQVVTGQVTGFEKIAHKPLKVLTLQEESHLIELEISRLKAILMPK